MPALEPAQKRRWQGYAERFKKIILDSQPRRSRLERDIYEDPDLDE